MPMNVEAQEAHSKGYLMDRILSLEDRLVQRLNLVAEHQAVASIQSRSLWTNTNITTTSSSCGGSKTELPLGSYPTFSFPIIPERKSESEFQKKPHRLQQQQRLKHPSDHMKKKQQQKNGKDGEEEKTCKSWKKKRPLGWPRLK